ncbi:MAG: ABC transporter substrate-binding protein [Bacillota bacterium]|nr:ABC transporter substrate-binding protein [Bacillota bacterium]
MLTALLAALLALSCGGCATYEAFVDSISAEEEAENVIKIGVFEPLSGSDEEAAAWEIRGIELAHELWPTVLGKELVLVYEDNRSDLEMAEKAANALVEEGVSVVLGSYSNVLSLAGRDIFQEAKIPSVAITNTNPLVTLGSEYSLRVCFVDSFQGEAAARYVYQDLGLENAAVLKLEADDYGAAMAQSFREELSLLTGNEEAVDRVTEYEAGTEDFTVQLEIFESSGIELVYMPVKAQDAAIIMAQAREMGSSLIFLGTRLWEDEDLASLAGEAAEGAVFTSLFDTETATTGMAEVFLNAYREKYGDDTAGQEAAALGFDAYLLVVQAIRESGGASDGETLLGALMNIQGFEGATGSITLDENGDPVRTVVIKTVREGAYVFEDTADPTETEELPEETGE